MSSISEAKCAKKLEFSDETIIVTKLLMFCCLIKLRLSDVSVTHWLILVGKTEHKIQAKKRNFAGSFVYSRATKNADAFRQKIPMYLSNVFPSKSFQGKMAKYVPLQNVLANNVSLTVI